ncbi:MAG: sulfatase-like hydrolase/transferase [Campylobacterales bacterium]|nr:sulfatase-like hydrolase/transferase [Campylobacterales bacterium]
MQHYLHNRFRFVTIIILLFLIISALARTVLLIDSVGMIELGGLEVLKIYLVGLFYDFVAASYLVIPFVLYLFFLPTKFLKSKIHHLLSHLFMFVILAGLTFYAFSEYFFWDEFKVRFNFIAVDYLVYTTEVIGNIRESYPMGLLSFFITAISVLMWFVLYRLKLVSYALKDEKKLKQRILPVTLYLLTPLLFFFTVSQDDFRVSKNQYNNELSHSGLYSLFSAFRNNTLEYAHFYKSKDESLVISELKKVLSAENEVFTQEGTFDISRHVTNTGTEKKHNVMMIVIESLSGEFLASLGGQSGLTPNLDALAKESLFFRNFYATGTRTVRGMEAITLSVPPTPGRSIVKRPDNEKMFSSGFVFREKGYETKFIYGGHGYFDNMNAFFEGNGFDVVDRTSFSAEEDTFHTVWGVSDENLLDKALKEADLSAAQQKPFFSFVMTTSNHRPYDYPEGRIDIPSHSGREGAVKYTDYAIGRFLKQAKEKPWFNDTIFVVVADHCASSAGKTELPLHKYHIPLFIYAPQIIAAAEVEKLSSQIDLMPTLFGLLNWSYESKFYGQDILRSDFRERALVGTYQKLGLYKDGILTVLSPRRDVQSYQVLSHDLFSSSYKEIQGDARHEEEAIAYYQGSSLLHTKKRDRYGN